MPTKHPLMEILEAYDEMKVECPGLLYLFKDFISEPSELKALDLHAAPWNKPPTRSSHAYLRLGLIIPIRT
ncbi:MAG: hypothetical protein JSS30_05695 [Verrucomicrobia bacterium]|nr:hypothetical protein [Verrucomicrobiota bacterium]